MAGLFPRRFVTVKHITTYHTVKLISVGPILRIPSQTMGFMKFVLNLGILSGFNRVVKVTEIS